jgi:hypothetical protein
MNQVIDLQPVPEPQASPNVERAMQRVTAEAETIADIIRIMDEEILHWRERLEACFAGFPDDKKDALREVFDEINADIRRRLEPWPKWVVNLAAEIFAVHNPTIPKTTIQEGFTLLHFIVFEWRLDRSIPFPKHQFESFDPALLGAMCGHSVALAENVDEKMAQLKQRVADCTAKGLLTPEKQAEHAKFINREEKHTLEKSLSEMNGLLAKCMEENPKFILRYSEGLANAKGNTFDSKGNLKEPPLMRIYEKIFEEWPQVEAMSGPTKLCKFLEPLLNENDPDKRLERVKQIRRRLGIVFNGQVRGTA